MKDPRLAYLGPVGAAGALVVSSVIAYAGFLTSDWGTLFACAPAILVTIGVVTGIASGVLFFGTEEDETPEEARHADGVALFDRLGSRVEDLVHRAAVRLHVRGIGH